MRSDRRELLPFFQAALASLAIASLTGLLFRGMIAWGWDLGAGLVNVRHAHSHTMFFAWVTPAIFLLVASREAAARGRSITKTIGHTIGAALVLGILTHPLFLRFGYASVEIGSARLPLAAIASGFAVFSWYAFALAWSLRSRGAPRTSAILAWRLAIAVLVLSTLAVWPLALLRPLGLDAARWAPVLSHAFLDPFSEGFLVLAVLGLAHAELGEARSRRWALVAIAVSAPVTFPIGLAHDALPLAARGLACVASIVWGIALLAQLATFATSPLAASWRWRVPLALGAFAALAKIVAGATPWIDWSGAHGLRLLYLHALLLGFVTLGVLGAARAVLGRRAVPALRAIQASALAVIAALVPLSEVWPSAWAGRWTGVVAALTAATAAAAICTSFVVTLARARSGRVHRGEIGWAYGAWSATQRRRT